MHEKRQQRHQVDEKEAARSPAWCPGGRVQQKALRAFPVTTESTAVQTAPAARRAAGRLPAENVVSECSGFLTDSGGARCRQQEREQAQGAS